MAEQNPEAVHEALRQIKKIHLEISKASDSLWQISLTFPEQEKESQSLKALSISAAADASKLPSESNGTNWQSNSINSQDIDSGGQSSASSDSSDQDSPIQASSIDATASQSNPTDLPDTNLEDELSTADDTTQTNKKIPENKNVLEQLPTQPFQRNPETSNQEEIEEYDVFLSYNTKDRGLILGIRDQLEKYEISCWFDEDKLEAGNWYAFLSEQLQTVKSVAFFFGEHGPGPHQLDDEIYNFLAQEKKRKSDNRPLKIIPVILKGANESHLSPLLLKYIHIDFNKHTNPLDKLALFIKGKSLRNRFCL